MRVTPRVCRDADFEFERTSDIFESLAAGAGAASPATLEILARKLQRMLRNPHHAVIGPHGHDMESKPHRQCQCTARMLKEKRSWETSFDGGAGCTPGGGGGGGGGGGCSGGWREPQRMRPRPALESAPPRRWPPARCRHSSPDSARARSLTRAVYAPQTCSNKSLTVYHE
ncbi:unnamed protein product [Plutella xylostella]|uniref:(diamondback moth) hypothetical protein n=1 Tax=Plutella xylostella TaxID=51655 RepID=A0A8S4DDP0_PLUXY|nr:unnamed protein product [Plutella xylostella]